MESTHKYVGPTMRGGRIGGLQHGDMGRITGSMRGGLKSFVRDDGKAFWIVPKHLQHVTRSRIDE